MKKRILSIVTALAITGVLVGCDEGGTNAEKEQSKVTTELMNEANKQIGMPDITNFFEKKTAKKIMELRDNPDLTTYAYAQNMDGQYIFIGECIGYGLPYSIQYTSPSKLAYDKVYRNGYTDETSPGSAYWGYVDGVIPQAEANGLYTPEGLSATWLLVKNPDSGETEVMYIESEITVSQSKMPRRLCAPWSLPDNY